MTIRLLSAAAPPGFVEPACRRLNAGAFARVESDRSIARSDRIRSIDHTQTRLSCIHLTGRSVAWKIFRQGEALASSGALDRRSYGHDVYERMRQMRAAPRLGTARTIIRPPDGLVCRSATCRPPAVRTVARREWPMASNNDRAAVVQSRGGGTLAEVFIRFRRHCRRSCSRLQWSDLLLN